MCVLFFFFKDLDLINAVLTGISTLHSVLQERNVSVVKADNNLIYKKYCYQRGGGGIN